MACAETKTINLMKKTLFIVPLACAACLFTGCAAGWGDCSSVPPDGDGCETNLTTANERVCSDGTCVPSATCCSGVDCTTPPGPVACFPALGSCASEGATCSYTQNAGSVFCGTTCCNPTNGSCGNSCALTCSTGFGHCTSDPSKGCESNLTTCVGTPCCGTACGVHTDGLSGNYTDCTDPLGTPGTASTYNAAMANDAAKAWASGGTIATTSALCSGSTCVTNVNGGECATWCYTGTLAGYVVLHTTSTTCKCPTVGPTSWK